MNAVVEKSPEENNASENQKGKMERSAAIEAQEEQDEESDENSMWL